METRINENETVTIIVNHEELTCLWLALDTHANYLNRKGLDVSVAWCLGLSRNLFNTAVKLGDIELERKVLNYAKHDEEAINGMH